ncbi:cytochrome P450 [Streptomyces misionensis]|uniref:cytochrome P450 n=1 Tax=Streptomyces misionensis TaxID=67331 RepID=UPI00343F6A41
MDSAPTVTVVNRRAITSLFSRLRKDGQADPLPVYEELREMGEVVPAPWGGHVVTSYRLCDRILRDRDGSWKVPDDEWRAAQGDVTRWSAPASKQMGASLPMLNPPHHTRMRKSLSGIFDRSSPVSLQPTIENVVEQSLDRFFNELHRGPADFCALVSEEVPMVTIGEWMNLPRADFALLRTLTHDQVHTQELFPSRSQLALSDAATAQLRQYFTDLIQARRKRPSADPVSSLLQTWDAQESDRAAADKAVHSLVIFLLLAALETTSHVLASTVRLLLQHPDQMDLLRHHPQLVPDAVEEVLRYDPPIHMISRVAAKDSELNGVLVREGEMVQLMIGAAHHDPDHYAAPHNFDIRRRASHLSFGLGVHYCLGNALARLEAQVLLTSLLERSARLRISASPEWARRVAFRRMISLPLTHTLEH